MSIRDIIGLTTPVVFTAKTPTGINATDKTLLYGVELEIERADPDWVVDGMTVTEDGSLRNNGFEFITKPMLLGSLDKVLTTFFNRTGQLSDDNYSERTSIHVHTNVGDLTFEQLASLCMLYQVFEGVLFNFIGHGRSNNIFCVPWAETNLTFRTVNRLSEGNYDVLYDWQKYTALNILPVTKLGTVEWRHMAGHGNKETIILWCQLIGSMFSYIRTHDFEEVKGLVINLNNTSEFLGVIDKVFGEYAHILRTPGYELLIENGVLNMKFSLMKQSSKQKPTFGQYYTNIPMPQRLDDGRVEFAFPPAHVGAA